MDARVSGLCYEEERRGVFKRDFYIRGIFICYERDTDRWGRIGGLGFGYNPDRTAGNGLWFLGWY